MSAEAWAEWDDDGVTFEKLRHHQKFHGHGKPHNPLRGMVGGHRVGVRQVMDVVRAEQRKAEKARRANAVTTEDVAGLAQRFDRRRDG
jgi:hypothetical protein